jgi:hypothetical protein
VSDVLGVIVVIKLKTKMQTNAQYAKLFDTSGALQVELTKTPVQLQSNSDSNDSSATQSYTVQPPRKKHCSSPFGHYKSIDNASASFQGPSAQLTKYIEKIDSADFDNSDPSLKLTVAHSDFCQLNILFERLFCVPASSAPVEANISASMAKPRDTENPLTEI